MQNNYNRLSMEALMERYDSTQLKQIARYCFVNDLQVLTEKDLEHAISLPSDSPDLSYFYKLPRGVKAPLDRFYNTTDFDCNCSGLCNITELSKPLFKALHKIRVLYNHPINIVKGYSCNIQGDDNHSKQHRKGNALSIQSSDNDRLYKLIDKGEFSHYSLGRCDHYIYLNLTTVKDEHGNISPDGPRFDLRTK